ASRDYAGSTVAAYLQRSLYYLECECLGTYITWNTKRRQALTGEEVVSRIASVMRAEKKVEAYLISSHPGTFEGQTLDPNLSFRPLKRFSAGIVPDETYTIFRVKLKPERAPAN